MTGSSFMSFVVAFKICTDSQVDEAMLDSFPGKNAPLTKVFWKNVSKFFQPYHVNNVSELIHHCHYHHHRHVPVSKGFSPLFKIKLFIANYTEPLVVANYLV